MKTADFRKELLRIMPSYNWTVHKPCRYADKVSESEFLEATGIQSSGFNRLSTLHVSVREKDGSKVYEAKSAPYGTKSPWAHVCRDGTLARALRGLQDHYQERATTYRALAMSLQRGRAALPNADKGEV